MTKLEKSLSTVAVVVVSAFAFWCGYHYGHGRAMIEVAQEFCKQGFHTFCEAAK